MKNYVEKGNKMAYANAGAAIAAGDVVIIGAMVGVAETDIEATTGLGTVCLEGVFELAKTTSLVITQGDRLFWNTSTLKVTKTVTDKPIGAAFESQATNDTTVLVSLFGNSPEGYAQAPVVAALAGTLTGTTDGTLANIADIATAGGSTPTAAQVDTAVNGAILSANLQLKELQTTLNAAIAALKTAGLMASA